MRRRQLYRAMTEAEIKSFLPSVDASKWQGMVFEPSAAITKVAARGSCSKCGKKIGKGVHFHEKACRGDTLDAGAA